MNVFLWIAAGLLAAVLLAAGASKLTKSRADLAASGQGWAEDFSPGTVKTIGVLEVLAAIGLLLPALLGIAPILVPLAASGGASEPSGCRITTRIGMFASSGASRSGATLTTPSTSA